MEDRVVEGVVEGVVEAGESWEHTEESREADTTHCRESQHFSVITLGVVVEEEGREEGTGGTLRLLLLLRLRQLRHELDFLDALDTLRNPFLGMASPQDTEHTQLSDGGTASALEVEGGHSADEDDPLSVGKVQS